MPNCAFRARSPANLTPDDFNFEPVESVGHLDLTTQPGAFGELFAEIEHIEFHVFGFANRLPPLCSDFDVAGGAGAGATAFAFDAFKAGQVDSGPRIRR